MNQDPQISYDHSPLKKQTPFKRFQALAVVRFTVYGEGNKPLFIREVIYLNNKSSIRELNEEISEALNANLEVSLITDCDIDSLIDLLNLSSR